jgi:hypothetical protein
MRACIYHFFVVILQREMIKKNDRLTCSLFFSFILHHQTEGKRDLNARCLGPFGDAKVHKEKAPLKRGAETPRIPQLFREISANSPRRPQKFRVTYSSSRDRNHRAKD